MGSLCHFVRHNCSVSSSEIGTVLVLERSGVQMRTCRVVTLPGQSWFASTIRLCPPCIAACNRQRSITLHLYTGINRHLRASPATRQEARQRMRSACSLFNCLKQAQTRWVVMPNNTHAPLPHLTSLSLSTDCSNRSFTSSVLRAMNDSSTAAEKAASVSYSCMHLRPLINRLP